MKHNKFLALLLSLLVLLALACSISSNPTAPQPTSDLQGTINAAVAITETAQANVQATTDADIVPTDTVVQPIATEVPATPTTGQEAQPSPTTGQEVQPSPTLSQAATAPAAITITDWGMQFFVPLSSGCKVKGAPCWKSADDYQKHFGSQLILTSKTPVLIGSNWPSPYLTFWDKRDLKSAGSLEIEVDGNWLKVRDFTKSDSDWSKSIINLSDYKGKELRVRFSADGQWGTGGVPQSLWFIQEVQVVPDYTP